MPPTVETLDAQADMILLVGKQKCTEVSCGDQKQNKQPNAICLHVNSAVVAGASPAFGLALYSPSAEAKEDGVKWTVKLPDDDPQAMQTIIRILYGYHPAAAEDKHMNLEQLLRLTILANKYDLVHLFTKWSAQWVQDMEQYWVGKAFVRKSTEVLESLLWIFWVLGHEPLYTYMVLQIAFYSDLDASGRLTDPAEQHCFTNESARDISVPPCASIEVGHARLEVLKMIRKDMKEILEEHLSGSQKPIWLRCRRMDGKDDWGWRQNVFTSFVNMLKAEGIWPLPSAHELTASPKTLVEIFRANPNIPYFAHHHDGRFCDADGTFWERIEKLLREVRFTLPAASANHLGEQAIKSGLASYLKPTAAGLSPNKGSWNMKEILQFLEFQKTVPEMERAFAGDNTQYEGEDDFF